MADYSKPTAATEPVATKSVSKTPSKPLESGIALFFYKDKHGTPNVLFKWGEEADTLLGGNGFSKIQMRTILEQHLKNTAVPVGIKTTILELISQLGYAAEKGEEALKVARDKRSSQQQMYRVMKSLKTAPKPNATLSNLEGRE